MSERSRPSKSLPRGPVRIVYHAKDRTFARLFNEHSLDEVKDVVRRKLGLGRETDVLLKQQVGSADPLDLEDDDDFEAFCVLLNTSVSVDIQVTVGGSSGSPMLPPVAPPLWEQPSISEPATTSSASLLQPPATGAARKRKVSFDDAALTAPDKRAERRTPKKTAAVTPVASVEILTTPEPAVAEEPVKKRRKREATQSKKSMTLDRESETLEPSPPPVKKSGRKKKDDGASSMRSSEPVGGEGADHSIGQSNEPVNEVSLQPAPAKSKRTTTASRTTKAQKSGETESLGVCATIPRTSECATVESEVAAAILSGYLSKPSESVPPPVPPPKPPAKRKYVRKDTKKSSASSCAPPAEPTTVSATPADDAATERRPEHMVVTHNPPPQTPILSGPPCPICLGEPFHIRYFCPTVLKGADAIRQRLEELERTDKGDQLLLIKELERLLCDPKVTSQPSSGATSAGDAQSRETSSPPSASPPSILDAPGGSHVSEVTAENGDEGSSSESSDDMSEVEHQELSAPQSKETPDAQSANGDLDAVIRGPPSEHQSVLHLIDQIVGDDDDGTSDSDSDSDSDSAELEDSDEELDRSRRRSPKHMEHSSNSEDEDEESRSPSSLADDNSNDPQSGTKDSTKPAAGSARRRDSDVVMGDPPVPGGQDDGSSEETHVGTDDRMKVGHESTGGKGATTIVERRSSSPARMAIVQPPSGALSNEVQGSGETEVDPASNQDGGVPVAPEVSREIETDPIEPADGLEPPTNLRSSNADPIEVPPEGAGPLFTPVVQSTPKPGVTKRIRTRSGRLLDNDAEHPVLLEQLVSEDIGQVASVAMKGSSKKKATEVSGSQEPTPIRRSPRFSSLPPSTAKPVAVVLLNHRTKAGGRIGKAAKTPAKGSVEDNATQNGARIAPTPSLIRWETLAEPSSSPSLHVDEPSVRIDELMSSSPPADSRPTRGRLDNKEKKARSRKPDPPSQPESLQEKQRLFDLSSSQIPFPYSQHQKTPAKTVSPHGKELEATDSDSEPKKHKKNTNGSAQYRPLSQLASHAKLFSPSLPTPANKSVTKGKTKKHVDDEESSSSSSSDENEVNGSEHIPRGRRAGSALETRKGKSLLSKLQSRTS